MTAHWRQVIGHRAGRRALAGHGGYGHSRMRERIFGGITHYVLDHQDIAVLIVH